MNPRPWKRYLLAILFLVFPLGMPLGIGIVISGIIKHRKIQAKFDKEIRIASIGHVIQSAIYISNAQLRDGQGVIAPALLIGSFDQGFTEDMATELLTTMMASQMGGGSNLEKNDLSWIDDESYHEGRRRKIPGKYTGGIEVYAFDVMLNSNWFKNKKLEESDVWIIATPGPDGDVRQIPSEVFDRAGVV